MKKIIFVIGIVLVLVAGVFLFFLNYSVKCTDLRQAELLMQNHPDSALRILQNISEPENLTGKNQALYALLYTQAKYKNGIPVKNDSLILFADKYYSESEDSVRKAWTCFYLAQIYENMQEPEKALSYFQKADIASQDYADNRFSHLLNFYWGKLLQKQEPYDESIDKFDKAAYYAKVENDTTSLILSLGELGWTYIWKHNYKKAQSILKEGLKLIDLSKQESLRSWLMQYLIIAYYREKQFEVALDYSNEYLRQEVKASLPYAVWIAKGDIFMELHQYDSAKYYFEKDSRYGTLYEKANYHRMWSKFEEGTGNYLKALEHQKLYAKYSDSIYETRTDKTLDELQKKYDYSLIKNENDRLKLERQSIFIQKLRIGLVVMVIAGCFFYYHEREKRKKVQAINSKNELIDELMRQMQILEQSHQTAIQETKHLRDEYLKKSEVYQKIKSVNTMIGQDKAVAAIKLTKEEMRNLLDVVDYCFDNFAKRLQESYPLLTEEDLAICSFIKMKTAPSNILFLLDTNKVAYKKRKNRIKHEKLLLGENVSLDDFLLAY